MKRCGTDWTTTAHGQQDWLEQVYSNKALLTTAADGPGPHSLRSSSSMPGLMTRMLEALDVHDGHRVLEIGTGTGYNTALLTHRLGDANVFSVEIEPDLLELARQRLAGIGYHPTLDPRTPWNSLVVWFLASFTLGTDIAVGYGRPDQNGNPTVTSITVGDGSWAEVTLTHEQGAHQVREGGPRRVWRLIEDAHALWITLGAPGWDRLGLTVTTDHQRVWLDVPTSTHTWPLAPAQPSAYPTR